MTVKRLTKREILNDMARNVIKPSQRKDAELASNYLNKLILEGRMDFREAKIKILTHFNITERELMNKYEA
ncbi:hypothetical protein [Pedobacter sp.]|uniref:hypothetical protein n=1 Tax=Pedobacter sp. TaxID=1411316 RepID=UPI003D7F2480